MYKLIHAIGQALTNQATEMAMKKRQVRLASKGSLLPKIAKVLCELGGWGCFVYGAFMVSSLAGWIVAGVAFLVFAWRIDISESTDVSGNPQIDPLLKR